MMEVAGGGEVREREGEKKVGRKKRRRRGRRRIGEFLWSGGLDQT